MQSHLVFRLNYSHADRGFKLGNQRKPSREFGASIHTKIQEIHAIKSLLAPLSGRPGERVNEYHLSQYTDDP